MTNKRILTLGLVSGCITVASMGLIGFEVERSSFLQLYNFNASSARACTYVWKVLRCNNDEPDPALSRFLREHEMDEATGSGWVVPMTCRSYPREDVWAIEESSHKVFLLKWKGNPFGVLVFGKSVLPKVKVVGFRCGVGE